MSDQQTDITRRVRALLAKTVENGCTEQEALTAAALARKMMDAHRLTQSDVAIEAEPIDDIWIERPNAEKLAAVDLCCFGISKYCGTKSWYEWRNDFRDAKGHRKSKRVWRVIGLSDDTAMARYLYQMLAATIARETAGYKPWTGSNAADTRRIRQSFSVGMAHRINRRLCEMAAAADAQAVTSTGTALVVVKSHTVTAAFDALGIKLSGSLGGPRAADSGAYAAGRAAGDRVNLSRPVSGQGQARITG